MLAQCGLSLMPLNRGRLHRQGTGDAHNLTPGSNENHSPLLTPSFLPTRHPCAARHALSYFSATDSSLCAKSATAWGVRGLLALGLLSNPRRFGWLSPVRGSRTKPGRQGAAVGLGGRLGGGVSRDHRAPRARCERPGDSPGVARSCPAIPLNFRHEVWMWYCH